eukprot:TRINITY_DN1466_c0_g1_i1.p2 TRINITY_DN1466_c0_g1~~TRINITY_DN1466_c0_g1_i1.p2  ORF type:complete len:118 (+),score=1.73 TRINITY_DN1466_c0_g1_i1:239-592(+)
MASTRCLLSSLLLVTLVSSACAASSGSLRGNPTVNSTLSPFEEAVQKLNASGFTKFASLAKVYGEFSSFFFTLEVSFVSTKQSIHLAQNLIPMFLVLLFSTKTIPFLFSKYDAIQAR